MKGYRLHWNAKVGWMIDVPVLLSRPQIERIINYALPRQIDRYKTLPLGERKNELARAILLLKDGKIQQRLVEKEGVLNIL